MITIVYQERLGDVLQMLPAARYLQEHGQGPIYICCQEKYRGAIDLVTYATWSSELQGEIIDLQIWPNRYEAFRNSGVSWMDFVYADQRIAGADRTIVLDALPARRAYGLPEKYNLLAPHGISQGFSYPLQKCFDLAWAKMGDFRVMYQPCPNIFYTQPSWSAPSLVDLALAIRDAESFMCINSAPAVLASAVRREKTTFFLPQEGAFAQDNVAPWPGRVDVRI